MFDARFDHAILIERDLFSTIERSDLEMKQGLGSVEWITSDPLIVKLLISMYALIIVHVLSVD